MNDKTPEMKFSETIGTNTRLIVTSSPDHFQPEYGVLFVNFHKKLNENVDIPNQTWDS